MTENTTAPVPAVPAAPVEGSWQDTLVKSAALATRSDNARKKASALLWNGAKEGIEAWLPESDTDANAEGFGNEVTDALGKARKGDASKIKTVALAVKNNGLVLGAYPNLSKAYAEATRLTKTVKTQKVEDDAAEEATNKIAESVPKSSSTPEGAALIVLSKGVDEAARLLLDALGTDAGVHRALLRAISQEIAGRVPKPAPKAPKKAATAKPKTAKATVKSGATKAKPKSATARKSARAEADGAAKAKPVAEDTAEVEGTEPVTTPDVPVKAKAKPVVVRR